MRSHLSAGLVGLPNIAIVPIPDPTLTALAQAINAKSVIPRFLDVIDIAGLVKGASEGQGLGNKFLGNIREVDTIVHLVRCFDDERIIYHVMEVDPVSDAQTIEAELALADLNSIEKRLKKTKGNARILVEKLQRELNDNLRIDLKSYEKTRKEIELETGLQLLSLKPVVFVGNISEEPDSAEEARVKSLKEYAGSAPFVTTSAAMEEAEAVLGEEEYTSSSLNSILTEVVESLDYTMFYTVGENVTRSWSMKKGDQAPVCAGYIHSDFEEKFISAEVNTAKRYLEGERSFTLEGREYVVQPGDVLNIRHRK